MYGFRAFFKELRILRDVLNTFGIPFLVTSNEHVYTITPIKYFEQWSMANWSLQVQQEIDISLLWSFLVALKAHGADLYILQKEAFCEKKYSSIKAKEDFIVAQESKELDHCYVTVVFHSQGISLSVKEEK
jgi:hypothetical protein